MARRKRQTGGPVVHAVQVRRLFLLAFCILTGFGGLGYRLYDLQIVRHEELLAAARENTERSYVRQPRRGDIKDRRGNLLATSKVVMTVCADPHMLGTNYIHAARTLSPLLDIPLDEMQARLRPRDVEVNGKRVPLQYVVLKRKVEEEHWERIKEALANMDFGVDESALTPSARAALARVKNRAVFPEPDQIRFYPNHSLAAHVLGYVGMHERNTPRGRVIETSGKAGLELTLNHVLTGIQGWRQTERDSRQRELVPYRDQDVAPRAGLDAVLTIDAGIQHIVEDELAQAMERHSPVSLSCIVVRPKTGEILAMANLPTFNPNQLDDDESRRRNRAVTDAMEPGSTFKIVVVAGAMNEGLISLDTTFHCENGRFVYRGVPLRDHGSHGVLDVRRIVSKSSNIGSAKIGIQMGLPKLYEYIYGFGFGQRTGIPLPGEAVGLVNKSNRWSKISVSRIPMGHEISSTALQMVMAMSAIANDGALMRPMLVERFVDEDGNDVAKFQPQVVRQVVERSVARNLVEALIEAASTNGTGSRSRLEHYTVAGKTGTAQKLVDGRYVRNKHYSSFIGFFPAEDPELCISVVLDEPKRGYYGGEAAAPIFRNVAERAAKYLAIPSEQAPPEFASVRGVAP